jgi:hypothetical protein
MTKKEKEQLLHDEWPTYKPGQKKALSAAIRRLSKMRLFDIDEDKNKCELKYS